MSVRRGSMTISLAPARSRFFMREANTGCASVGLAADNQHHVVCSTESKSWCGRSSERGGGRNRSGVADRRR